MDAYTQDLVRPAYPWRKRKKSEIEFGQLDVQKEKYREAIGLSHRMNLGAIFATVCALFGRIPASPLSRSSLWRSVSGQRQRCSAWSMRF